MFVIKVNIWSVVFAILRILSFKRNERKKIRRNDYNDFIVTVICITTSHRFHGDMTLQ